MAALVSLTFNRGASYAKSGPRYREMREIRGDLNTGSFNRVPGRIRSMKRLWVGMPDVRGLLRRRDEEAELFEKGLSAAGGGLQEAPQTGQSELRLVTSKSQRNSQIENLVELPDAETLLFSAVDGDEDSELDRAGVRQEETFEATARRRRLTLAKLAGLTHSPTTQTIGICLRVQKVQVSWSLRSSSNS